MKKFLAVLTILALALSLSPVAFAGTNSYMQIFGTVDDTNMCALQVDFASPITKGQSVSFDFRPYLSDEGTYNGLSLRFFNAAAKGVNVLPDEYDDDGNVISYYMDYINEEPFCDDEQCVVTQGHDGWCNVTFVAASDMAEGFFVRFYYGDAAAYEVGTVLQFDVDNFKIGDKVCSFNDTNVTAIGELNTATFKFDDGTEFTAAKAFQMDWTMAIKTEESTNPANNATPTSAPTPDSGNTGNTGSDNNQTGNGNNQTGNTTDDNSADTVWIIVGVVIGVALVAGVLVCVIVLKKRKA